LIINDCRCIWRIIADENSVASRPAAAALNPLLHRLRLHECDFLAKHFRGERPQRSDVINNPKTAAVGGEDELVVPRLNRRVSHRDGWKVIALELGPGLPAINRSPKSKLGSEEK